MRYRIGTEPAADGYLLDQGTFTGIAVLSLTLGLCARRPAQPPSLADNPGLRPGAVQRRLSRFPGTALAVGARHSGIIAGLPGTRMQDQPAP